MACARIPAAPQRSLRLLLHFSFLCFLLVPAAPSLGAEPVRIGVTSFRPKPSTLAQWQPLADRLRRAIPGRDFVVEALTFPEMNAAVAQGRLDFVVTNPGHFVLLRIKHHLSAPLATLTVNAGGRVVDFFGGVIVTRASRTDINRLQDLKGKTIAAPDKESMGGYQMQAYELLRAGVQLPRDARLLVTGMPHDNVLAAVLQGRADAGFIRSGVLEGAERDGKFDVKGLRVLNLQEHADFPQRVSTRFYPEWPVSARANQDPNLARRVAAALFTLHEDEPVARAIGIHGFSVPADYTAVEQMLRALRFPPFDANPDFSLRDVWARYRAPIMAVLLAFGAICLLGFRLILTKRRLETEKRLVVLQTQKLGESEAHLRAVIEAEPEWVGQIGRDGTLLHMNRAGLDMIEAETLDQVRGHRLQGLLIPGYREAFNGLLGEVFEGRPGTLVFEIKGFKGGRRWMDTHAVPLRNAEAEIVAMVGVTRDITDRVTAEREKQEAVARIRKLEGILPICMHCKKIRDDQDSWNAVEVYITQHSEAHFSHGLCPQCAKEHYDL